MVSPAPPRFSVVIPSYNRAALLPETLRSVAGQSWPDWECLVVDDGSTDETRAVVAAFAREDSRIRYFHQQQSERSAARNHGIREALGRYICFLDSDDRFAPEYLESLDRFLTERSDPVALVVSGFQLWDGDRSTPVSVPPIGSNPAAWLFECPVSPSRACLHRDVTTRFRFREDISVVEDSVLWVSLATTYPVLWKPEPLVHYRVHAENSVSRGSRSAFSRHEGLVKFFNEPLSDAVPARLKRDLLSDVRFRMAEWHAAQGHYLQALATITWSILTSPGHYQTRAKVFFILEQIPGFRGLWRLWRPTPRSN